MKSMVITMGVIMIFSTSVSCASKVEAKNDTSSDLAKESESAIIHLTHESFKQKVFDYPNQKEWVYEGNVPAIIDFYADWCSPCRLLSPILEDIQKQYGGKIQVYKVNTEKERELAAAFGIQSLPTLVFVPLEGKPQAVLGLRPKEELSEIIKEVLKVQ